MSCPVISCHVDQHNSSVTGWIHSDSVEIKNNQFLGRGCSFLFLLYAYQSCFLYFVISSACLVHQMLLGEWQTASLFVSCITLGEYKGKILKTGKTVNLLIFFYV